MGHSKNDCQTKEGVRYLMNTSTLIKKCESGTISIRDISSSDYIGLLKNDDTEKYALLLMANEYTLEFRKKLNEHMDAFVYMDEATLRVSEDTKDLVSLDSKGNICYSKSGISKFFSEYYYSMVNIADGIPKPDYLAILKNMFFLKKNIKTIHLNNEIISQVQHMDNKYIYSSDSRYCISSAMKTGWKKIESSLKSEDCYDMIEVFGLDTFIEKSIDTVSKLSPLFNEYKKDADKLISLLRERNQSYFKYTGGKKG